MRKVKVYLTENMCFGRNAKGKNIMLYAFQPLKITAVSAGAMRVLVKPIGKGNYREYLVNHDLLTFAEE